MMWDNISGFFEKLVRSGWDMLKDLFLWIFETLLALIEVILQALDSMFSYLDMTQYLTMLPADVVAVAQSVGAGEASGIVILALTIRILLQLIPFVRLGS